MSQGNPNKVNAIVDEIVENNNLFKLKSPIEQDKEKYSIAKSINSAISILNEVGKELVLQELSVDPDEKFKGFIDSVGNIDISGLTQMTANIVKAKIEEAEREGIDLRQGQPVFKDSNKTLVIEGVLTVAVIDTMIKNYDNLSNKDIQSLINGYDSMPPEYQDAFNKAQANMLNRIADGIEDKDTRDAVRNQAHNTEDLRKRNNLEKDSFAKNPKKAQIIVAMYQDLEFQISTLKKTDVKLETLQLYEKLKELFNISNGENLEDILAQKAPDELTQIFQDIQTLRDNVVHQSNEISKASNKLIDKNIRARKIRTCANVVNSLTDGWQKKFFPDMIIENNSATNIEDKIQESSSDTNSPYHTDANINQGDKISQEIEQIPNVLAKVGFTKEQIRDSFSKYIATFKNMDQADINELRELDKTDLSLAMQTVFSQVGMEKQIASILSQITYNNQLLNILEDKDRKEQFLKQFESVVDKDITSKEHTQLDDELAQIFTQYFQDNAVDMTVSAIETQKEQATDEQVKQEETKEMYSFIDAQYLQQDSIEGLIPRNGDNSKALQDDKKSIFYSQGKEGAIVMYFEFLRQYNNLKGVRGDKALQEFANYQNGSLELTEKEVQLLQEQLSQINKVRLTQDFDEFMGDKLYLKLHGIDTVADKQAADQWRASHPGTKMNYNYANSWTNYAIPPDRIDVISLQNINGNDIRTHQSDLIKYFLSQTSIDKIETLGVNDATLNLIKQYYEDHSEEIANLGENYSLVSQNIQEFEQSKQVDIEEKTDIEQESTEEISQNMALVEPDNSFIGKIKRVFANMKDMKNKDNSKGFFARLGASIQTVFGNKKEEYYEKQDTISTSIATEDKSQPTTNSQQINYLSQHFDVNTQEAIKRTEESKKAKEFLSTEDKETDDLLQ